MEYHEDICAHQFLYAAGVYMEDTGNSVRAHVQIDTPSQEVQTSKAELIGFFKTMTQMRRIEIAADMVRQLRINNTRSDRIFIEASFDQSKVPTTGQSSDDVNNSAGINSTEIYEHHDCNKELIEKPRPYQVKKAVQKPFVGVIHSP